MKVKTLIESLRMINRKLGGTVEKNESVKSLVSEIADNIGNGSSGAGGLLVYGDFNKDKTDQGPGYEYIYDLDHTYEEILSAFLSGGSVRILLRSSWYTYHHDGEAELVHVDRPIELVTIDVTTYRKTYTHVSEIESGTPNSAYLTAAEPGQTESSYVQHNEDVSEMAFLSTTQDYHTLDIYNG